MTSEIYTLKFGINRCYLIRGDKGVIMIDGGPPLAMRKFRKYLERYAIEPEEIKLIILTHGDFDHAGSADQIRELTGAHILIHEKDRDIIEKGIFSWAPGASPWGKISRFLFYPLVRLMKIAPFKADQVMKEEELSLANYGITGTVLHTPGHTEGHIGVVMDSGEAFVGCMAHNFFLFTLKPKLPIYALNIEQIKHSWKSILDQGVKIIYPGHGKSFHADRMIKYLSNP